MLAEPVEARLVRSTTLTATLSTDSKYVALTTRPPVLKLSWRLPLRPCELWHRTDVSDSHVDRSHRVCPPAPCAVYVARPMLAPCIVTLADPVAALLVLRITLSMPASRDSPALTLPYLTPALIPTCRLPITPCPTWHRTDVSASHVVRSHAVLPTLVEAVYVVSPRLDPCTVTLDDPVAARLLRLDTLTMPRSPE